MLAQKRSNSYQARLRLCHKLMKKGGALEYYIRRRVFLLYVLIETLSFDPVVSRNGEAKMKPQCDDTTPNVRIL